MLETIIGMLVILLIFIITALPLYFAVKFLRGKTNLWKTIAINLLAGILVVLVNLALPLFGGIIAFVLVLVLYRFFFRVSFLKAFFIWILELILIILFGVLAMLLGIGALGAIIAF